MIPRPIKRLLHQARLNDPAYRFLFEPGPPEEVVSFDCETTGLDARRDDIITIAAVLVRGNRILTSERFEAVARPEARINIDAMKVHRLREMDVAAGEPIQAIIPRFLHFAGGRPLVGYYVQFDVRMVDKYL
jgi:DNA polymerase III subunit epsilon